MLGCCDGSGLLKTTDLKCHIRKLKKCTALEAVGMAIRRG